MKRSTTIRIDSELHERAMRMCYWTPGLSFAGLVERLLGAYIEHAEKENGKPFPERKNVP